MIEDPNETREGWSTDEIGQAESVRGFHGPLLRCGKSPRKRASSSRPSGFRKTGVEGEYHRFEIGKGGAGKTIVLLHEPTRHPEAGPSARARSITSHWKSRTIRRSRSKRDSTKSSAIPTARRSRIEIISIRFTCGRPAEFWWSARRTRPADSPGMKRSTSLAGSCSCRHGLNTAALKSCPCSSRSACLTVTDRSPSLPSSRRPGAPTQHLSTRRPKH